MRKLWNFLNSPLFDFIGGTLLQFGAIIYFIGILQIVVDPYTFIFAAIMVIGFDCYTRAGEQLFLRKKSE